jgi:selenocysteine-specific elongation factor
MKHFIIATAGHVDHGKSSLVKALTGTDPDRLPEEKARGMTIDLGFAELNLGDFHLGIVDVPGHDAFVRNMIAGVGSIDLALFVVAADDGWMPQTEEHLQILTYLGVERAVFALTKIDIGDAVKTEAEIRNQLRETAFAQAAIIPTSVRTGEGLEYLKQALIAELSKIQPPRDIGKPRLFVDRAFKLRGIGTVVTGTLIGGTLRTGENVLVQPGHVSARIRSLQSHGHDVDLAQPGMRTALNLPDLELETDIQRGHVLTAAGFETTDAIGVVLEKSPRSGEHPLKNRTQVYLHHGTARIRAKVIFFNKDALRRSERAVAQLRLDSPVVAFLGDRFVLRDPSEQFTIAGGIVLDPDFGRDADLLRERATAPDDVDLCVRTEMTRRRAVPISTLLLQSHFAADEIIASVKRLDIPVRNELAIDRQHWSLLRERAVNLIDQAHRESSDKSGLELNALRAAFRDEPPELIDALLTDLCANEFVRARSTIARSSHQPALPPELRAIAQKILEEISAKPFDPPARKRIAPDSQSQQALRFLIENGEIVELAPDTIVAAESFARMKDAVIAFISKNGRATVSDLRQALQTSRRIMVPFLERLDRDGVTRRFGDERKLADEVVSHSALE